MSLVTEIRSTLKKRAMYRATVRELQKLDGAVARDLDIAPSDVRRIARQAVYG
ncbi:hypothetical protein [Maliponia aquimaris]|uniref:DUF1127 domain-containing protein n=1 Tax=Maliponia aquimaris TaxID=1673631 RepID=A0A238K1W2_9RHOB|nr:hypothetical protein [Maliponia aquimaris]SMX35936.1 hypothetical protein MAA8898_00696 [Maliponia aquimaris]